MREELNLFLLTGESGNTGGTGIAPQYAQYAHLTRFHFSLPPYSPDLEMSALFTEYDQDGDGGINFEEFEEITVRAIDAASSLRTDDDDDDGSGGTCGVHFCWIFYFWGSI